MVYRVCLSEKRWINLSIQIVRLDGFGWIRMSISSKSKTMYAEKEGALE